MRRTFTLASRSVGEPALPSCTFMSAADEPLSILKVGDVRLFNQEFVDVFLQVASPNELSPVNDLFCEILIDSLREKRSRIENENFIESLGSQQQSSLDNWISRIVKRRVLFIYLCQQEKKDMLNKYALDRGHRLWNRGSTIRKQRNMPRIYN